MKPKIVAKRPESLLKLFCSNIEYTSNIRYLIYR